MYRNTLVTKLEEKYGVLPITITDLSTKPKIFGFDMAYHEHGLYPAIHYFSKVAEYDTEGQQQEFEHLKDYMKKKFPDLAANQGYVFYRRFDETYKDSGEGYLTRTFIDSNAEAGKSK